MTITPHFGRIHAVSDRSGQTVLAVHMYGPAGPLDGRDYEPSRDFVCDRPLETVPIRSVAEMCR
jgi:hypothetical protein